MSFALPKSDKRTVIVGSTGSGKTFTACWLLGTRDWHLRPWYIIDFKGDQLIADIEPIEIDVSADPPTAPGLYVLRPLKNRDDDLLQTFLWKVWENENAGIYTDEGYMIGNRNGAFTAILTQGRSKNIEMITLVQRPVWIDKFVFSEANHFCVMRLQLEGDRKCISEYLDGTPINRLPKYRSYWYSADEQEGWHLMPVPGRGEILDMFERRRAAARAQEEAAMSANENTRKVVAI